MTNTVDQREIEQFSSLSNRWWDKSGPFAALHKMSNARIEFIKLNASRITDRVNKSSKSLDGISCLDVGCGGGILSEPLTRLGAAVTGIDASKTAIQTAKKHALKSRLKINYKCITTSELLRSNQTTYLNKFDIVIASEVIEHVIDKKIFLSDISRLCRLGGIVIFTTINNSFPGILMGKYIAENIIKVVPKNTHDPKKFISPKQLTTEAEKYGIILDNFVGFRPTFKFQNILNKEFGEFKLSSNLSINYGAAGIKLKSNDHPEPKEHL